MTLQRQFCLFCLSCGLIWGVTALLPAAPPAGERGFLLLEGNRIAEGTITPEGATYAVVQKVGKLVIPAQQVRFHGANMQEVHRFLQDQLPRKPQAADHIELARWCISFGLLSEARLELTAALELEPTREDIRTWLTRLDLLIKQPPTAPSKPAEKKRPVDILHRAEETESLAGLSRTAGQTFTKRIHPMLMNNCTNSACHGPRSEQTFQLEFIRANNPNQRGGIEQNLLEVLKYVDRERPRKSTLYQLVEKNHGAQGRSVFQGPRGAEQAKLLQDWILSLKHEEITATARTTGGVVPVAAQVDWTQTASRTSVSALAETSAPAATGKRGATALASSTELELVPEQTSPVTTGKTAVKSGVTTPRSGVTTGAGVTPGASGPRTAAKPAIIIREGTRQPRELEDPEIVIPPPSTAAPEPQALPDAFDPGEFNRMQRARKATGSRSLPLRR